jgi:hypothetical protein
VKSDRGVDDLGGCVVLARGAEHPRDVGSRSVTFSHADYDAAEARRVPPRF